MIPGSANPLLLAGAAEAAGYEIERSLRFNSADSAYLSRTPNVSGDRKTWTWAGWVKIGNMPSTYGVFAASTSSSNYTSIYFQNQTLKVEDYVGGGQYVSAQVFRDPSAWYHVVLSIDTTRATTANRVLLYVNGTLASWGTSANWSQNLDTRINSTYSHVIGAVYSHSPTSFTTFDGYLADVHFIDGQALDPTSFTEVDATTGQLVPKAYTGSYGTNGFHLPFSDNSTAAALGTDTSGNGNDWTANNISVTQGSVAEATGALPLYNTTDTYGSVKGTGFRSDSNASALQIAVAGGSSDEVAYAIRGTGSALTLTNTNVTFNQPGKFYSDAYLIQNAGAACEVQEFSDAKPRTNDFCVEFWINPTTTPANSGLFSYGNHGTIGSFAIITTGSGTVRVDMNGSFGVLTLSGGLVANQWQHFALTRSGTTCKLYRNGVSQGSWTIPAGTDFLPNSNPRYVIGNRLGLDFNSYNITSAYFQDFRVYVGTQKYSSDFNIVSKTAGAGNDSLVDTPTNGSQTDTGVGGEVVGNYATLNPLDNGGLILTNGNLNFSRASASWASCRATIGISSGKWYWEINGTGNWPLAGIMKGTATLASYAGGDANGWGYYSGNGQKYTAGIGSSYGATWTDGAVIGVAFDADNGTLTFYKNNSSQGIAFTGLTSGPYFPAVGIYDTATCYANFGQRPFAYTAPSGYKALCTTNLPEPTIADGSTAMDVVTYTGNGSTQTISGLGFSPDLVWIKNRADVESHGLFDQIRGADLWLSSNTTGAETDYGGGFGVTTFTSTGFTVGNGTAINRSGAGIVAWTWDAGSSTVTNTDGSITSQVRANASAGFSIVTYTGTGANATVGHGLNVAPSLVIVKRRDSTSNWLVWNSVIAASNAANVLFLDTTDAALANSTNFNSTSPTSTVFTVGTNAATNASGGTHVAYCFAPVAGYSSFGSYVGNGSADGPFVYTGFRPRWLIIKNSSVGGAGYDWYIFDAARQTFNVIGSTLAADLSGAEFSAANVDLLSNGFKLRNASGVVNGSGNTIVYAAFAESPFQYARAR